MRLTPLPVLHAEAQALNKKTVVFILNMKEAMSGGHGTVWKLECPWS